MMLKKNAGTTLIEVLVASGILVSIITLLTVALTSTFEGYSRVLSSAQVEQDAQYITARLQYATTRADRNTLAYHTTSTDFSTGALYQTQVNTSSNGEVGLSGTNTDGTFTSAPITLASDETIRSFTSSVSLPANTSIGYQIGVRSPIASACPTDSTLYGYAWDTTTTAPLSSAPIAWYKMDESTWSGATGEVLNSATNSYNGTSSGGAYTTADGMNNRAGRFDGVDDYISGSVPMTQTDNWTMSAWIYPSTLPQLGMVVSNGNDDNIVGDGYAFGIGNGSGSSGSKLQGVNSGVAFIDSGYTFPAANAWYHVAMVRSSGTIKFYVNGIQTASTSASVPTTPTVFRIGSQTGIRYFNGRIDDVRIYNYVRSQNNIITDMSGYVPRPAPPISWWKLNETSGTAAANTASTSLSGTQTNGPTWVTGKYNNAASYDGTDDYTDVSYLAANDLPAGNISMWVKFPSATASQAFFAKQANWVNSMLIFQTDASSHFQYQTSNGAGMITGTTVAVANTWYYIAANWNGATQNLYVNGVKEATNTTTEVLPDDGNNISIGAWTGDGNNFGEVIIDDVRIYNYARTATQIADDMNGVDPINVVDYFTIPTGTYDLPIPSPTPNFSNPGQCIIYKTTYTRSDGSGTSPQTLDVTIKK